MTLNYSILPNGSLRLFCDRGAQAVLEHLRGNVSKLRWVFVASPDLVWGSPECEHVVFTYLTSPSCNLEWLPPNAMDAPTLGLVREMHVSEPEVPMFGKVEHSSDFYGAIVARWIYTSSVVCTFLDDLADNGESIWEGGYAPGNPQQFDHDKRFDEGGSLHAEANSDAVPSLEELAQGNLEATGSSTPAKLQLIDLYERLRVDYAAVREHRDALLAEAKSTKLPYLKIIYFSEASPLITNDPPGSVVVEMIDGDQRYGIPETEREYKVKRLRDLAEYVRDLLDVCAAEALHKIANELEALPNE